MCEFFKEPSMKTRDVDFLFYRRDSFEFVIVLCDAKYLSNNIITDIA